MKRFLKSLAAAALVCANLAACSTPVVTPVVKPTTKPEVTLLSAQTETFADAPKYIFLFIGDGMSYVQVQAASYYLGAVKTDGGVESWDLSFMDFPVAGSAQTYDSTSFAPNSASTATSIATGNKTYSGTINMDTTFTVAFETIAEQLKAQKDYKVGIISSVNINHATPAAFYAHQASRNSYYDIGLELIESEFDYFAGGQLLQPTGSNKDRKDILELAEEAGYTVVNTYADSASLTAEDGKAILIAENLDSAGAMNYALDAEEDEWTLADYTEKGIEMLMNDTGFFMMVEGGKIDWAGHANDAAANIHDTLALSEAVAVAVEFMEEYPEDTLILVTGDHETGGLSIGFAGTNYDTFLTNIAGQSLTYEVFSNEYVPAYKANNTRFGDVLADIQDIFGLVTQENAANAENSTLVLTPYEYTLLHNAYIRTMAAGQSSQAKMTGADYILYGTYDPLTVTITHLLNNKSGLGWTSYAHTGVPVPVFAAGSGAELFSGYYDNTDIYNKLAALTGVK